MAITPVLACYRTSDVATGGITAWQLTTGPSGPRTDVVARCPLGDAPWVTPLYDLVVVLCGRDSTLCVVRPGGEVQVVGTAQLQGQWPCHGAVDPTGRLMAVANCGSGQVEFVDLSDPTQPTVRSILNLGRGCVFPGPVADRQEGPMLTR